MLAYNLMVFTVVGVCLAAIHLAFQERQRTQVKRCIEKLIASVKKRGVVREGGLCSAFGRFSCPRFANILAGRPVIQFT